MNHEEMQLGTDPLVKNVSQPLLNPPGGSYTYGQAVTVACATPDTVIRCTFDGSEPTLSSYATTSGHTFNISSLLPLVLKAKAWKDGWLTSDTESGTYIIQAVPSNLGPTVSISAPSGTFLASDNVEIIARAEDNDGTIAKIQLFRGDFKVAETTIGALRFTLHNVPAGTYTFTARAIDDAGAVGISPPVTVTVGANAGGPVVSLVGAQPLFVSSPGALIANIAGVNPGSLFLLTLNGTAMPLRSGEFVLYLVLVEGENTFTLTANGSASATTKLYLDSVAPVIAISKPLNNSTFGTTRVNVTGIFTEASLERITVNGVIAFITGSGTFEARNVPLDVGANTITATAEDIAGNTTTATINVTGSATLLDPVQLAVAPIAGFDPLTVSFSIVQQNVSGTAYIDFEGDGTQTAFSASHIYTAGQHFPVVTIVADGNRFSSIGGWNASPSLRVNVQQPLTQVGSSIAISDPVDLKIGGPSSHLFVLSRTGAFVNEYDSIPALVRSITLPSGSVPTGLDVDATGNVYVVLSGHHQVAKYKLVSGTYALDTAFSSTGLIGKSDHTPSAGSGEFDTPYDVAITPDGTQIAVSDSANHRIQMFSNAGEFLNAFGTQGSGVEQFNTPKGLAFDPFAALYVVDSGNNRVTIADDESIRDVVSGFGTAVGKLQLPLNIAADARGIYVADSGNNRVQKFDAARSTFFDSLWSTPGSLGLSQPGAVAVASDLVEEKIWIADTANARVLLVRLPSTGPEAVWNAMKQSVLNQNLEGALTHFSGGSASAYRQTFTLIGMSSLAATFNQMSALAPVYVTSEAALYTFQQSIEGHTLTFTVKFILENGEWKLLDC